MAELARGLRSKSTCQARSTARVGSLDRHWKERTDSSTLSSDLYLQIEAHVGTTGMLIINRIIFKEESMLSGNKH